MSDFKPGDVALYGSELVALTCDDEWIWLETGRKCLSQVNVRNRARRPALVDPEDPKDVERLWRLESAQYSVARDPQREEVDAMQAALREFANPKPPKPEEPTGLGAVVEDDEGDKWVKVQVHANCNDWVRLGGLWDNSVQISETLNFYRDIAAVRVLSVGVPS